MRMRLWLCLAFMVLALRSWGAEEGSYIQYTLHSLESKEHYFEKVLKRHEVMPYHKVERVWDENSRETKVEWRGLMIYPTQGELENIMRYCVETYRGRYEQVAGVSACRVNFNSLGQNGITFEVTEFMPVDYLTRTDEVWVSSTGPFNGILAMSGWSNHGPVMVIANDFGAP